MFYLDSLATALFFTQRHGNDNNLASNDCYKKRVIFIIYMMMQYVHMQYQQNKVVSKQNCIFLCAVFSCVSMSKQAKLNIGK